ncbi:unnamed protein product, partial [Didymodactylos carnosus]
MGNVVAIDRDPNVKIYADQLINDYPGRMQFMQSDFASSVGKLGSARFDGIVMDLGVSSMQLDSRARGFSFTYDGPLDMRMSHSGYSAADFINNAGEQEIADVIYQYGDETYSRKIARKIIEQRQQEPITSTSMLASIIHSSRGPRQGQLEQFLNNCKNILASQGKLIIVSFHSLEDRIVKNFFKANAP